MAPSTLPLKRSDGKLTQLRPYSERLPGAPKNLALRKLGTDITSLSLEFSLSVSDNRAN